MGKRILIGSMLVLTTLLLMPSIPAVQQKTIEEGFKQEIQEKLDTINLNKLKDIEVLESIRHPILYILFSLIFTYRVERSWELFHASAKFNEWGGIGEITRPIIFLRCLMLSGTTLFMFYIMWSLSYNLGWGWFGIPRVW